MSRVVAALAALAIGVGSCSQKPPRPARRIVLVSIDTLRADHLGTYGYPRATSPKLDAFAAEGAVFEDAATPAPWTLPAHGALLTGLYPEHNGLTALGTLLPESVATLASELGSHGFVTAAAVNTTYLAESGLERAFQEFLYVPEAPAQREPTRAVTDRALEWIARYADQPFFLLVHYYDVHSDYRSLPQYEAEFVRPYDGRIDGSSAQLIAFRAGTLTIDDADTGHLVDLYDAGIRQMDDELARLLAALPPRDDTLVVVVADHGDEFRDHGGVLHGRTQFQEIVHVPFVMRGWQVPRGVRIATPVSLIDVLPTILAAAGVPASGTVDGADLAPLLRGQTIPDRYLAFGADHNYTPPNTAFAVRHGAFKLHFDRASGKTALYDLSADPGEHTNVADRHPEVVADLRAHLRLPGVGPTPQGTASTFTPEQLERLRSLGYLR